MQRNWSVFQVKSSPLLFLEAEGMCSWTRAAPAFYHRILQEAIQFWKAEFSKQTFLDQLSQQTY